MKRSGHFRLKRFEFWWALGSKCPNYYQETSSISIGIYWGRGLRHYRGIEIVYRREQVHPE